MAGRICVREEGLFLRNYRHRPMRVHAHVVGEEGEQQHDRQDCTQTLLARDELDGWRGLRP